MPPTGIGQHQVPLDSFLTHYAGSTFQNENSRYSKRNRLSAQLGSNSIKSNSFSDGTPYAAESPECGRRFSNAAAVAGRSHEAN